MPIPVICPGCKKRFNVSDKFAGKKGPCPTCKTVIQVPEKAEEVVVHAPQEFGPKGISGKAVLKPIARIDARFSPLWASVIAVAVLVVAGTAWALRPPKGEAASVSTLILAVGALGLALPLTMGGYTFVRDDELEPFRGTELLIRSAICSAVYAGLWALVAVLRFYVYRGEPFELTHLAFVVPILVAMGAFGAFASLDLDYGMGAVHYGFYLAVTVLLRLIMKLPAL